MQYLRDIAKKILPTRFIEWYRRRRATKRYLQALAYEIYDRGIRMELDDLEGRIAARRDGFYERLVRDVLERTELVLQELDRKIEGVSARHGRELRELHAELESIRTSLHALTGNVDSVSANVPTPSPAPERQPVDR
jgi:hypothetical protein